MNKQKPLTTEVDTYVERIMSHYWPKFADANPTVSENLDKPEVLAGARNITAIFMSALMVPKIKLVSDIDESDIIAAALRLRKQIDPSDDQAVDTFEESLMMGSVFLGALAGTGQLTLSESQVAETFDEIMAAMLSSEDGKLVDGDFEDPDRLAYHYDNPDLPPYLVNVAEEVNEDALNLVEEFVDSDKIASIQETIPKRVTDALPSLFQDISNHMYGESREEPSEWTTKSFKKVMKNYFIKDALVFPDDYQYVEPIGLSFIDDLVQNDFISEVTGIKFKTSLSKIAPAIIKLGSDQQHFSDEKREMLGLLGKVHEESEIGNDD